MSISIRGEADATTNALAGQLKQYEAEHPAADITIYRHNPVSVRVRVIDPAFRGRSRSERHRAVWPLLYPLSEDTLGDLTMLLLITPEEKETSPPNSRFEQEVYVTEYNDTLGKQNLNTPN